MEELKIELAQAEQEVNDWLVNTRRMSAAKITASEDPIKVLIEAVSLGNISIDLESGKITHKLIFPVKNDDGGIELDKLEYSARLRYKDVKGYLKGVKNDDGMGMVHAHICGLVKKPMAFIDNLEFIDLSIGRSIASLFL